MKYNRCILGTLMFATLLACTPAAAPGGHAQEALSICGSYGFAAGAPGSDACATKFDPLVRAGQENRARCEALRQQTPAINPSGGISGGFGSSVVQNDAAYRICLTERAPPPVQLEIPAGRTVTCELVETHIQCY